MSTRLAWIMLTCTLLCSSCAKTHGVSLGSTSEEDDVDADAGSVGNEGDDESHDQDHRDGEEEEEEEDERPFWLEPFESEPETTANSLPSR